MNEPDFLIIGAMKCATSTLHEQLSAQPGFFMTEPKEPNFFSNDSRYEQGWRWYQALFDAAPPGALRGESSTHYSKLPTYPDTIARMKQHLGVRTKFLYVMRQPESRLISQYIHEWTQRVIRVPLARAIHSHPELLHYSCYARQLEPYLEAFGRQRVLGVFFERLQQFPQQELERIGRFLGVTQPLSWKTTLPPKNVSSQRLRRSPVRDWIVNAPVLRDIRTRFVPQSVRDRIKDIWRMKQRPALSGEAQTFARECLDRDLQILSRWLGEEVRCSNWTGVAQNHSGDWAETPKS